MAGKRKLPSGILALGLVSLFMDASSELVHSLLPALFVSLGVGMAAIGLIEGVAEATAAITKVFSGSISDWLGKRKILAVIGYGLAAITKPLFPLAQSAELIFAARFIDRVGKGIRGAPRDALIADLTSPGNRGAAYGLRQSLDTVGAFLGPLAAFVLMIVFVDDVRSVLWFALIPAALCIAFLVFGVKEPKNIPAGRDREGAGRFPLRRADLAALSRSYWLVVAIGGLFALARFSEAFLTLRALDLGLPIGVSPLIMVLMSIVYSLTAYPVGLLADRMQRGPLLALGLGALICAGLVLSIADDLYLVTIGIILWGLHMGLTQGLLSAMVADSAPDTLRGTAFGVFNLINGVALLIASVVAGLLWQMVGASTTFFAGAGFATFALVLLLISRQLTSRE
ncbi:putative transporter [Rhodobiaceae bacterium]|nr:putative transporter [Rhodobiaceae bacterium]